MLRERSLDDPMLDIGRNLIWERGFPNDVGSKNGVALVAQVHHPFLTDFRTDCIQSVFSKNSTDNSLLNPSKKL